MKAVVGVLFSLFILDQVRAHVIVPSGLHELKPALASFRDLQKLQIAVVAQDEQLDLAFAYLSPEDEARLQENSHQNGKCGGYEVLSKESVPEKYFENLKSLRQTVLKQNAMARIPWSPLQNQPAKESIIDVISQVQETNLYETVTWLSSFKNRNEKSPQGNDHIQELKLKIESMLKASAMKWSADLIVHEKTKQKSLRVRLEGSKYKDQIVILGGHHDSVNHSWTGKDRAPGADDNASGSANLLEILRLLSEQNSLDRTVEIMWYAGEESGLLGSAEIAKAYKQDRKDVIAVMQLDMTLFPGNGEMTIVNITDFTHPWLQELMKQVNTRYVDLKILDEKCGYACSDHASWFRQGFPTVMPFESTSAKMNPQIHTAEDLISPKLSFKHSAAITKLSLAFALELANSELRVPN